MASCEPVVLTVRELQILAGCAAGLTAAEIGAQLYLAEGTVVGYRRRACQRRQAPTGTHAVAEAYQRGLLPDERFTFTAGEPRQADAGKFATPDLTEVHRRFPSTTWGEKQWTQALTDEPDLYLRLLSGIAVAHTAAQRAAAHRATRLAAVQPPTPKEKP